MDALHNTLKTPIQNNFKSLFAVNKDHLASLDGLRAIAIILVVLLHLVFYAQYFYPTTTQAFFALPIFIKWLAKGTLGVDIFFVLSGFLIGTILLREIKDTNSINLLKFFKNRFLRLIPVYFLFLVLMVGISPLLTDFLNSNVALDFLHQPNQSSVWTNLFYINNFFTRNENLFATFHTWSLAIEEQFYFLTPIVLIGLFKFGWQNHAKKIVFLLIVLFFLLRLVFIKFGFESIFATTGEQMSQTINGLNILTPKINFIQFSMFYDFVYDNLYTRYIGLLFGVVTAYLYVFRVRQLEMFFSNKTLNFALLFIALAVFFIAFIEPYFLPKKMKLIKLIEGNFLFSLAIAYIVLATIITTNRTSLILTNFLSLRFFTPIARISYSAYLFHVPVIFITYNLFFSITKTAFELIIIGGIVSVMITTVVSVLSYIFIEQTFRMKRKPQDLKIAL